MRPLLLPGLLDAARHNAARGRPAVALFESAHVSGPGRARPALDGSPGGATPPTSATTSAPAHAGPPRGARARPADFYAAKGIARGDAGARGRRGTFEPGERPFLHPGRAGSWSWPATSGSSAGSASCTRAVAREWDIDGAAAFEIDFGCWPRSRPGPARYQRRHHVPRRGAGHGGGGGRGRARRRRSRTRSGRAGALLDRVELFDVYRGEQVGEGQKSLALRLEFRAPDRTLSDEDVAPERGAIERALERDRGAAACIGSPCSGARLRRRAVRLARGAPPVARADDGHGALGRGPAARPPLSALPRAPRARELRRRPCRRARRRRARRVPARRGRAGGRGPAEPRAQGRGPVGGLPPAARALRALVPAAPGAGACWSARSTACPSCTARRSAAPTSWPGRAATPPPRCSRSGRCASWRATPSWTRSRASPARAARPPRRRTSSRSPRT